MTGMRPAPLTSAEAEMSASHAVLELGPTISGSVSWCFSYVRRASRGVR